MDKYIVVYIQYKHTINNKKELIMHNNNYTQQQRVILYSGSVGKTMIWT